MASEDWQPDAPLGASFAREKIAEAPHEYEVFQALRLLLLSAPPGRNEIGASSPPAHEPVRLKNAVSHSFAGASLTRVSTTSGPGGAPDRAEVQSNHMGLFGSSATLPRQYTDPLTRRLDGDPDALRAFLDLFNHRALSLHYLAWKKYRLPVEFERAALSEPGQGGANNFTTMFLSLVGLGLPSLRRRLAFSDQLLVWFGGHFSRGTPSADALRAMLGSCLSAGVEVLQLIGSWAPLEPGDQLRLTGSPRRSPAPGLGAGSVLGKRVWLPDGRFRIRVGPLRLKAFQKLCPGGVALRGLAEFVRTYVGAAADFEVQLILIGEEAPLPRLARQPERRLGVDTWLLSRSATTNLDDAVFRPAGFPQRSG